MPRWIHSLPRIRAAGIALSLLLSGVYAAVLPESVGALGGPPEVTVFAEGEVQRPGAHTLPGKATLSALIVAAGGFRDRADLRGAILARKSARASQEAELRKMAADLFTEAGTPGPGRETARSVAELLAVLRPSGRIHVELTHPRLLRNTPRDLLLEEGDILRIPEKGNTVTVAGAVRSASGNIPFTSELPYGEYIRRAGGYAEDADRGKVFLLRADGTTVLLSLGFLSWNAEASRWEVTALTGGPPAVGPGDTIVVPRSLPRGLPRKLARKLPGILVRATEIAGAPVILP